jgi:N-terminal acetyltransferase B complex non-catalytic subunit
MGYLHCAHLPSTALASLSKPIYDQTLKFFTASYKDSLEYLAMSYKYGSFSKLQEFMDFREKLSNSLHYSMVSVEALLQEIVAFYGTNQQNYLQFQNMKIEPNEDRIKYEELTDNRDLNVMLRWDPIRDENNESVYDKIKDIEKESFNQDVELLRIRSTLLRIVASSVELIHSPYRSLSTKEQNGHSSISSVEECDESHKILINTWDEHFNLLTKLNYQQTSSQFLVNLLPSRLHVMLQLPYNKVFSLLGKFVYNLWMSSEETKELGKALQQAFLDLKSFIENLEPVSETSNLFYYRGLQAKFIGCVEVIACAA